MTCSNYFSAQTITQSVDDPSWDVEWHIGKKVYTLKDVYHHVNTASGAIRNKTNYIHFKNFDIDHTVPNVITGIQLILKTRRNGRVFDELVAMSHNEHVISDNKTSYLTSGDGYDHLKLNDTTVYGGEGDLWGLETIATRGLVSDPTFGVSLRFQGHPMYPHTSGMQVESVQLCFFGE